MTYQVDIELDGGATMTVSIQVADSSFLEFRDIDLYAKLAKAIEQVHVKWDGER